MANTPKDDNAKKATTKKATTKKAAPRRAAKKAAPSKAPGSSKSKAQPKAANHSSQSTAPQKKDGPQELKEGVSRLFSRGRSLLSEKGPGFLSSIEHATHTAIDHTAKGITAFERVANETEAKVGKGLKDLLGRRRKPGGPSR